MNIAFFGPGMGESSPLGSFQDKKPLANLIQSKINEVIKNTPDAFVIGYEQWGVGSFATDTCLRRSIPFAFVELVYKNAKKSTLPDKPYVVERKQKISQNSQFMMNLEADTKTGMVHKLAEFLHEKVDLVYCFFELHELPVGTAQLFENSKKVVFMDRTTGNFTKAEVPSDKDYWIDI